MVRKYLLICVAFFAAILPAVAQAELQVTPVVDFAADVDEALLVDLDAVMEDEVHAADGSGMADVGAIIPFPVGTITQVVTVDFSQFPRPPDVPEYVEVVPTYAAGTTANTILQNTVTPYTAVPLTDISTSQTGRLTTGSEQCLTVADPPGTCTEAKFRTVINDTTVKFDDPIRNWGQPGQSHCHNFFGNFFVNAFSTYESLRLNSRSFAAGAELNATAYWRPCLILEDPFGDGKDYIVKADRNIVYYVEDPAVADQLTIPPIGLRYIIGYDMDDPEKTWLQAHIDAANAQAGTAGRYRMNSDPAKTFTDNTGSQWACNGQTSDVLKNSDGTDPFGGLCTSSDLLNIQFAGQNCWDGKNLWSPTGYRHVIPKIYDTVASAYVCPNNYYEIGRLQGQSVFTHEGFSGARGYGNMKLACHAMAEVAEGKTLENGRCFHTDWMFAWDGSTWTTMNQYCLGAEGNTPHECNTSSIGPTGNLITGEEAPDGRDPQVNLNHAFGTATAGDMIEIPASMTGPVTIDVGVQ